LRRLVSFAAKTVRLDKFQSPHPWGDLFELKNVTEKTIAIGENNFCAGDN
jgi:hypothetical protein